MPDERRLATADADQAQRFYDRLRAATVDWAGEYAGSAGGGLVGLLLAAPDFFILLWRLLRRPELRRRSRWLLAFALSYFLLPVDLVPDWVLGPLGFADDLMLAAATLRTVLLEAPRAVVLAEWSGSRNLIDLLTGVAHLSDWLARWPLFGRVRRLIRYLLG